MAQFVGVLALLLSETPVLPLNVHRYTSALTLAMDNLRPNNSTVLGIHPNCLSIGRISRRTTVF